MLSNLLMLLLLVVVKATLHVKLSSFSVIVPMDKGERERECKIMVFAANFNGLLSVATTKNVRACGLYLYRISRHPEHNLFNIHDTTFVAS